VGDSLCCQCSVKLQVANITKMCVALPMLGQKTVCANVWPDDCVILHVSTHKHQQVGVRACVCVCVCVEGVVLHVYWTQITLTG
jgi:hypothetical protein